MLSLPRHVRGLLIPEAETCSRFLMSNQAAIQMGRLKIRLYAPHSAGKLCSGRPRNIGPFLSLTEGPKVTLSELVPPLSMF